jgi:hypothetical protein
MGSESGLWKTLRRHLRGKVDTTRHEDAIGLGIPDVSYGVNGVNGWIELKHSPDFPKKDATPVRLRHFTDEQRLFLISRGETGGYCWVLWQIKRDYFLFDHTVVWQLGDLPKQGLLDHAYRHWTPKLDTETLIEALQVRIQ